MLNPYHAGRLLPELRVRIVLIEGNASYAGIDVNKALACGKTTKKMRGDVTMALAAM